jgi:molybdopterin converting factor small subunit
MKNSISITVKLFAHYREGRFKVDQKTYPQNTNAGDIVKDIGINESDLPIGVLLINGRHVKKDYILKDGDNFSIFPKVGGG